MAYGQFKTYEEVALKFGIKLIEQAFVEEQEIIIAPALVDFIKNNLKLRRNYVSENAICEMMIAPILGIISYHHDLPLWSHVRFDISAEEGLIGVPDFLVAPASPVGTIFVNPVICVAEVKKENFNEGWAQVLAEMIAAQRFNGDEQREIFGIVTTGNIWQFGKLQQKALTIDVVTYSALENLSKLFNIINWLYHVAKLNLNLYNQ
ncbi:MAG: hypothetical protein HC877_04975 [Thioploca sp.]|nr:hypothetical protein [Thioploca sp.]